MFISSDQRPAAQPCQGRHVAAPAASSFLRNYSRYKRQAPTEPFVPPRVTMRRHCKTFSKSIPRTLNVKVVMTIMNGRVVYECASDASALSISSFLRQWPRIRRGVITPQIAPTAHRGCSDDTEYRLLIRHPPRSLNRAPP